MYIVEEILRTIAAAKNNLNEKNPQPTSDESDYNFIGLEHPQSIEGDNYSDQMTEFQDIDKEVQTTF